MALALASPVQGQSGPLAVSGQPVLLAVMMNGFPDETDTVFQLDAQGHLFAPESFLVRWNLRAGDFRVMGDDGGVYVDLEKIQGLSYSWDHSRAELAINASPEAFTPTRINAGANAPKAVASYTPGGHLKYDLSTTHGPGLANTQGLFDMSFFSGQHLFTNSLSAGFSGGVRLMSAYQLDRIDAIKTLRIGDSFNSTGAWGRGVLFGGIQYGTNFNVRPDFITTAMPSVSGQALLPATVDVYVNNALRSRQQVNSGPFSIQNLPVITGAGDAVIVVKDLLGREQRIVQPFFTSPSLLREGLVDDSYEFGWVRQNYGQFSNHYANPFATATYRKGLSKQLTGEIRGELQRDSATAGLSGAATLPALSSVIESSLALSYSRKLSAGAYSSLSYSFLGRRWSANARLQLSGSSFRQIGSDPANLPRQIGSVQLSVPLGAGTLSANYVRRLNLGESLARVVSVNYSQRIGEQVFGNVTLIRSLSPTPATVATLSLTMIHDHRHFAAATLAHAAGGTTLYSEFQQSTPRDEGTGYRLAMLNGGNNARQEASITRNHSFGSADVDLVRLNGANSGRLTLRGDVALLGGELYFARDLGDGFAVAQVKDQPGVAVYHNNQVVAHTDRRGRAVVGGLHPYQENLISIDPLSLRLELSIGNVQQTVIPRSRGGILVDFEVRQVRNATLAIVQSDGQALPPWTPVEVEGVEQIFTTGNRGEVFVELPRQKGNRIIARPPDAAPCELQVDLEGTVNTVPFLGPLSCAPMH
ncbi:MAG: fimbria/pilus outer membrane usher protein [Burkholderiaceae bacterium]|nr:fimbria/pilus outer membrane usher protein [Burkholderiaceae bacterium]